MHIYTLRNPMEGEKSIMNGKLLICRRLPDKRMLIRDVVAKEDLWLTTEILCTQTMSDGVYILTSSGSSYDFIDVSTLIPTSVTPRKEEPEPAEFTVVDRFYDTKPIHYGDGYILWGYEFSREITEDEFKDFLVKEGHDIRTTQQYPFEDYAKISGEGNKWQYKLIKCYTD